jgi:hypothetical protein
LDNNLHSIDAHRETKRNNKQTTWLNDKRVKTIAKPAVRFAVASLLDGLGVDFDTLSFSSTANTATYTLMQSLLSENRLTRVSFLDEVKVALFKITGLHPNAVVLSSPNSEGGISIVYVR